MSALDLIKLISKSAKSTKKPSNVPQMATKSADIFGDILKDLGIKTKGKIDPKRANIANKQELIATESTKPEENKNIFVRGEKPDFEAKDLKNSLIVRSARSIGKISTLFEESKTVHRFETAGKKADLKELIKTANESGLKISKFTVTVEKADKKTLFAYRASKENLAKEPEQKPQSFSAKDITAPKTATKEMAKTKLDLMRSDDKKPVEPKEIAVRSDEKKIDLKEAIKLSAQKPTTKPDLMSEKIEEKKVRSDDKKIDIKEVKKARSHDAPKQDLMRSDEKKTEIKEERIVRSDEKKIEIKEEKIVRSHEKIDEKPVRSDDKKIDIKEEKIVRSHEKIEEKPVRSDDKKIDIKEEKIARSDERPIRSHEKNSEIKEEKPVRSNDAPKQDLIRSDEKKPNETKENIIRSDDKKIDIKDEKIARSDEKPIRSHEKNSEIKEEKSIRSNDLPKQDLIRSDDKKPNETKQDLIRSHEKTKENSIGSDDKKPIKQDLIRSDDKKPNKTEENIIRSDDKKIETKEEKPARSHDAPKQNIIRSHESTKQNIIRSHEADRPKIDLSSFFKKDIIEPNSARVYANEITNLANIDLKSQISISRASLERIINSSQAQIYDKSASDEKIEPKSDIRGFVAGQKSEDLEVKIKSTRSSLNHFANSLKEAVNNYKPPITKIAITLNPARLGSVDVVLRTRGKNLEVSVSSNPQAVAMLYQNSGEFRQSLLQLGFSDVNLSFSSGKDGGKNQNPHSHTEFEDDEDDDGSLIAFDEATIELYG